MSNMGYCRFQNTLADLRDCYDHIEDVEDLSEEEARARKRIVKLCLTIADESEDYDGLGEST